ncbi:MAG: TonB-dependent receptor plug domain-containing protein, partial [Cyanobacteria bacterium P01_E01_bin.35]
GVRMKLLSVLLSVAGVSGLVWVCPVGAVPKDALSNIANSSADSVRDVAPHQQVSTSAKDLLVQSNPTRVSGIEVNQTTDGLEVILKTEAGGEKLVPFILSEGKNLTIDILDAVLATSISKGLTETNPAPGITEINLVKVDDSSIRLTITGENQAPSAEVVPSQQDLVLSISPEANTAQQNDLNQTIDVIITEVGTRTETDPKDVPQSIQVIPQEIIQKREVNEITEALENVPGVISSLDNQLFNDVLIRGFAADYRRNGLKNTFLSSTSVQTANIERLEVLKGPASVLYGSGSFGGTI